MRQPPSPASLAPRRPSVPQRLCGLLFALFLLAHLLLLAGLALRADAVGEILQAIHARGLLAKPHPALLSLVAAGVTGLLVSQAWLALRRLARRHEPAGVDGLGWLQAGSSIAVFLFTGDYLHGLLNPPAAEAAGSGIWPVCIALLFAIEVHAGVIIYRRFAGSGDSARPSAPPRLRHAFAAFFVILGVGTLAAWNEIDPGGAEAPPVMPLPGKPLDRQATNPATTG